MPVHTQPHSLAGAHADVRDFYRQLAAEDPAAAPTERHLAMVRLIDRLDREFQTTDIWLCTSHSHLVFSDAPDRFKRLVTVNFIGFQQEECFFSYRLADAANPFPKDDEMHMMEPEVSATAIGLEQTVQYLRIAMRESGGWPESTELGR